MCLGIPGRIVALDPENDRLAIVDVGGMRRKVNISCIVGEGQSRESCIDTWVLVHVGFAMSRIDEVEAQRTLELLFELGEAQQELAAMRGSQ
jgi:hydrogenase expression/formation protein HypC